MKMKKVLTIGLFLLILGGCTAQTTSYLEYHKWIPVSQSDSSLKNHQGKEVRVPAENQK